MEAPDADVSKVAPPPRGAGMTFGIIAAILAVIAVIGVVLVVKFVDSERARDLRTWQIRLGIVADSRFAAVEDWLDRQYGHLKGLAQNASLQIYMTELSLGGGDRGKVTDEAAQAGYLRNLLVVSAARGGFVGRAVGPVVKANVRRVGVAGIALLDMKGRVLVATPEMPPLEGRLREFVTTAPRGARALDGIYMGASGTPTMAFIMPVFAVQGDVGTSEQIGIVLGVKEVGDALYPLLQQPGATEETAETLLVRATGSVVEYLSPLMDGTPPLMRKLALNTPDLAASFAIANPGGFAIKRDYRDQEVLVTGRQFTLAPWVLVHKVDRAEALAESDSRLTRLLVILLLLLAAISAGIIAVWWHGSTRRARDAATRYRDLAARHERQGRFLQLVTDSQPDLIFIVDSDKGRFRFANRMTAERAGIAADDLIGKTMAAVLGPEEAKRHRAQIQRAMAAQGPVSLVERIEEDSAVRVVQSEYIPLAEEAEGPRRILVVERDITAAVTERERRERILHQLVRTLVAVVDRRDPYAANHSIHVGTVAHAVAEEMGLDPVLVETAENAGNLMNLGKILVPESLLTKPGSLSEDEMKHVRDSIQTTADIIEGIEFDGPVVDTLRQLQERWDGTGWPRGLKGEEILITARIVAVANAFVALVSARAYRPGVDFDRAIETLLGDIGTAFDRRVVAALINCLDSRGARAAWADFAAPPAAG